MAGDPQMVFVDGVAQRQVASASQVGPGTFAYDWAARRLVVGADPARVTIEAATRPVVLVNGVDGFQLRGIGVRRYASNEYYNITGSALYASGSGLVVERSAFVDNAGGGLYVNPRSAVVRSSVFVRNGANGLGANGHSRSGTADALTVVDNAFSGNNAELFGAGCSQSCAAANVKIAHVNGFRIADNLVEGARGPKASGLWCDLDCRDGVFVGNLVRDNGDMGIFYEVSDRGTIAGNVVTGSGSDGIRVTSANTAVVHNTLLDNRDGIWVYDDRRSPLVAGTDAGPDTTGVTVANNVVRSQRWSLVVFTNATSAPGTRPATSSRRSTTTPTSAPGGARRCSGGTASGAGSSRAGPPPTRRWRRSRRRRASSATAGRTPRRASCRCR
ncbi:MAG: right-handed parallel beta-helix repeat-containing protein [Quadrisphaera sp.]